MYSLHEENGPNNSVLHYATRISDQLSVDISTFRALYAFAVLTDFSGHVKRNVVRKQDACKKARIHVDPLQHANSEVPSTWLIVWFQLNDSLHFVRKEVQPFDQKSTRRRTRYLPVPGRLTDGFRRAALERTAIRSTSASDTPSPVPPDCLLTVPGDKNLSDQVLVVSISGASPASTRRQFLCLAMDRVYAYHTAIFARCGGDANFFYRMQRSTIDTAATSKSHKEIL